MGIRKIHHVALVTDDIEKGLRFWRDALGLDVSAVREAEGEAAQIAFLPVGEGEIELVRPTTDDSGLAKFLAKRGPGMHHVCLEVEDIEAMLERLRARGVRLINERPRSGKGGRKYAFIHPESTGGVLVELYQL